MRFKNRLNERNSNLKSSFDECWEIASKELQNFLNFRSLSVEYPYKRNGATVSILANDGNCFLNVTIDVDLRRIEYVGIKSSTNYVFTKNDLRSFDVLNRILKDIYSNIDTIADIIESCIDN